MTDVIVGATYSEARAWKLEWDLDARPLSASAREYAIRGLIVGTVYVAPGANRVNPVAFNRTMSELRIAQLHAGTEGQVVFLEDPMGHKAAVEPEAVMA